MTALHLTREFETPIEQLYEAFTNPAIMVQWWGPASMSVYRCEVDLRVGGTWFVGLQNAKGEHRDVSGKFTQVDERAIAFTWQWEYDGASDAETVVSIVFERIGATRSAIYLTQQTFESDAARTSHHEGWNSSLNCLEDYLNRNA